MKKLLIVFAFITAVTFMSCGNKTTNNVTTDTVDTVIVDTVDSVNC